MNLRRFSYSQNAMLRLIALIAILVFYAVSLDYPVESRAQSLPGQMRLHIDRSVTSRLNYWFETPSQRLTEPKELRRSPDDASVLLDASVRTLRTRSAPATKSNSARLASALRFDRKTVRTCEQASRLYNRVII